MQLLLQKAKVEKSYTISFFQTNFILIHTDTFQNNQKINPFIMERTLDTQQFPTTLNLFDETTHISVPPVQYSIMKECLQPYVHQYLLQQILYLTSIQIRTHYELKTYILRTELYQEPDIETTHIWKSLNTLQDFLQRM